VAAFLMVLIGGSVGDVRQAARTGATDLLSSASLWIKPGGPENVYTTQRFSYAATKQSLEKLPAVDAILPWRDAFLDLPKRRVWVLGVPRQLPAQIAPSQLIEGSLGHADRLLRGGGWVAMSQPIARELHVRIGDHFALPTPSGYRRLGLAATIANYGWLPGAIIMNADDQARFWQDDAASELAVKLKAGVGPSHGKAQVESALPDRSGLSVQSVAERRSEVSSVLGSTLARLNDTSLVVLVVTIASVIALMLAAIWQRRARLDSLTAIGMSPLQFARLVSYESGLVLLSGCLIGAAAGLLGQYLIDGWLHKTTGASVQYSPAWLVGARTFVLIAAICGLASLVAVAQTTRSHRQEAFSIE
jgi:putative ABC transport system permease protein